MFKRRAALVISLFGSLLGWSKIAKADTLEFKSVTDLRDVVIEKLRRQSGVDSALASDTDPAIINIELRGSALRGDVTNLFQRFRVYPDDDKAAEIDRWIRSIVQWPARVLDEDNLVVVLRTRDYIDNGVQMGIEFVQEPLVGDLFLTYMVDMPDAMSPMSIDEAMGRDLTFLRERALENVREWLPNLVREKASGVCSLYYVEDNTMLSPSLVLLEEFWKSIEADFPGDCLFAIPRRDQLFIFHVDAIVEAKQMIAATFEDDYSLLSDKLYARRGGKLMRADN